MVGNPDTNLGERVREIDTLIATPFPDAPLTYGDDICNIQS